MPLEKGRDVLYPRAGRHLRQLQLVLTLGATIVWKSEAGARGILSLDVGGSGVRLHAHSRHQASAVAPHACRVCSVEKR